jgi:hypothetical protein
VALLSSNGIPVGFDFSLQVFPLDFHVCRIHRGWLCSLVLGLPLEPGSGLVHL